MAHKVITSVTAEPVSLAEAKLQLRLDDIGGSHPHDGLIAGLITSAREFAQHYTGRALAPQTLEIALDAFPREAYIDLPRPPVTSVSSIKYDDEDNVERTMSTADYSLSTYGDSRRVNLGPDADWPGTYDKVEAVRIRYVTGYANCPRAVKAAILLMIQHLYENPMVNIGNIVNEVPMSARSLLNTIKLYGF